MASRLRQWWRTDGKELILSRDVGLGVFVFGLLFGFGYLSPQLVPGPSILTTEAVVGGAVLAVSLTALAILVAFLGDEYIALLEKSVTIRKAILPYQVVASISASAVLTSIAGIILYGVARDWGRDALGATASGLTVCSVIGTVQIVNITARHGKMRARLPEIREAAREAQKRMKAG